MFIELDSRRLIADDGPVVTFRFDEDAMTEIRGYIAERGNDEIRAIFDEAEARDTVMQLRDTGEYLDNPDPDGDKIPVQETVHLPVYTVTLPQAARTPFVAVLSGIGAGGVADELSTLLEA